jgi:hypothetical protein
VREGVGGKVGGFLVRAAGVNEFLVISRSNDICMYVRVLVLLLLGFFLGFVVYYDHCLVPVVTTTTSSC